jgi:hypothetical protein
MARTWDIDGDGWVDGWGDGSGGVTGGITGFIAAGFRFTV